jgi:hypothetical protein
LKDFLFYSASSKETIGEASLLLTITPATCSGLFIHSRIPIWVKKYKAIASNQVQTTTSSLTTQKESNQTAGGVIELVALSNREF